jgi:ectoine hydroxylase-related dioxygenase (phytanoyl-CoA dioxygenase family)
MLRINLKKQNNWLDLVVESLRTSGCVILEGILSEAFIEKARARMYAVQTLIHKEIGTEKLRIARELGILRLMMRYDPFFIEFIEINEVLALIDSLLSPTAIMHLQNGFILPSFDPNQIIKTHQNSFHRDLPLYLNGYLASFNILFAIDEFTSKNGATLVVPGTQQKLEQPTFESMQENAILAECPAGSALIFDSTLWHAAGINRSGKDRLAVNHQFTRSFFKQQLDYVRSIKEEVILAQKPRTQQILGYYTRLPSTLEEYYVPEENRLYRKGQA